MYWSHKLNSVNCDNKTGIAIFCFLHSFTDRSFDITMDLSKLSVLFFLSILSRLSLFHLEKALHIFSLAYLKRQYHSS